MAKARAAAMGAYLPNLISLARLLLAPAAVGLVLAEESALAFWVLVVAGVSDAVDGILARRLNARSLFGAYIDAIADKTLLISIFVVLGYTGDLPVGLVVLVVARDLFIMLGVAILNVVRPSDEGLQPLMISKINTVFQILLAGSTLAVTGYRLDAAWIVEGLIWIVAATTVLSWLGYTIQAVARLRRPPEGAA